LPADAAPSRVWVAALPPVGSTLELSADESHYLVRVCRVRPGARVDATDGCGRVAELVVRATGRVVAAEVNSLDAQPRRRCAWVCCGAPEGERADWLVEKLAELGVAVFQPVDCERGAWRATPARLERWRRLARAALRQSRQAWLLDVREPLPIERLSDILPAGGTRSVADPAGAAWITDFGEPCVIAVGPSGGLSGSEKDALRALEFRPIRLGDSRLRTETAALLLTGMWAVG
jgi:16S rRNA (uracil1498-N3)-methyltransferase